MAIHKGKRYHTLREVSENGLRYWALFVLVNGRQILADGEPVEHVYYFVDMDTMHMGRLSAPASLESVREGDGWYQFKLGDGRLTVWPSIEVSNGI